VGAALAILRRVFGDARDALLGPWAVVALAATVFFVTFTMTKETTAVLEMALRAVSG
jgi:hypothetical protein